MLLQVLSGLCALASLSSAEEVGNVSLCGPQSLGRDNEDVGLISGLIHYIEGIELNDESEVSVGFGSEARFGSKVTLEDSSISLDKFNNLNVFRHRVEYPNALQMKKSKIQITGRYANIRIKWGVKMDGSSILLPGKKVNEVGVPVSAADENVMADSSVFENVSGAKVFIGASEAADNGDVQLIQSDLVFEQASTTHIFSDGQMINSSVSVGDHSSFLLATNTGESFLLENGKIDVGKNAIFRVNSSKSFEIKDQGSLIVKDNAQFIVNAAKFKISQTLVVEEGASFILRSNVSLICYVGADLTIPAGKVLELDHVRDAEMPRQIDCNIDRD